MLSLVTGVPVIAAMPNIPSTASVGHIKPSTKSNAKPSANAKNVVKKVIKKKKANVKANAGASH